MKWDVSRTTAPNEVGRVKGDRTCERSGTHGYDRTNGTEWDMSRMAVSMTRCDRVQQQMRYDSGSKSQADRGRSSSQISSRNTEPISSQWDSNRGSQPSDNSRKVRRRTVVAACAAVMGAAAGRQASQQQVQHPQGKQQASMQVSNECSSHRSRQAGKSVASAAATGAADKQMSSSSSS